MAANEKQVSGTALRTLEKPAANSSELRALFARQDVIEQLKLTLPKHMSPERLSKVMLSAVLQTPKLMKCNQLTLVQTLTKLSELGLEPGSALGHVYLLPFENRKAGRWDVQIIIGYKGYLELMRRSGWVTQIETHVVFEDDKFELVYGLDDVRKLRHEPNWKGVMTPEKAILVYCIARMKDGATHVEVMPMSEVRGIRNRSQSYQRDPKTSPWTTDELQMARKTIVRRAQNYLPLSPEERDAHEVDEGEVVEGSVVKPDLVAISGGEELSAQVAASAQAEEQHDPVTGEVAEPGTDAEPEKVPGAEPEKGTVDHLLWRIENATGDQLPELVKEAGALPKDEPRRSEVGKAIAERRKAVAQ